VADLHCQSVSGCCGRGYVRDDQLSRHLAVRPAIADVRANMFRRIAARSLGSPVARHNAQDWLLDYRLETAAASGDQFCAARPSSGDGLLLAEARAPCCIR
jgi:hypothetical protein